MNPKAILSQVAHRPWPLPTGPWVMTQTWSRLLFAHYPLPPGALAPLLPAGLAPDTFDGQAWIGVVPFRMSDVRPRLLPPLPWLSYFPELNVRTYVKRGGKAGVFFLSLEAANPVAVAIARGLYRLPYFNARMFCRQQAATWVAYKSIRTHKAAPPAHFLARYRPTGPVTLAAPGTLAHWLTERYALFTADRIGRIYRGEIHHVPWPLQPAELVPDADNMAASHGLALPASPPLLHYAHWIRVLIWPLLLDQGDAEDTPPG